ncbi:MAG TPA: bifunctional UDP-N-acetylglucosamine diphosphorylase/glucosamine-1-phosphate N-acetyltransferase GlmU [Candidatus Saccharimonadia bacterium]|nr:bifunctional UDP-N-acetylglucosamine diphosphorylase/glucosamine-1-phosphate N-acetyltransferase GlmU [Candidatus Saccharimonadia bacterium]
MNPNLPLHVIVLAAGEGKRMKSALPKVLMPLAGQPMLTHVLELARALGAAKIHVVHGHGGTQVRQAYAHDAELGWAEQAQQLGTGHAVLQAMPAIPEDATVLVLYGDVPLITLDSLRELVASDGLVVLAETLPDPKGYGRIVTDANDRVAAIVEEKDASTAQRAIRLVNTGVIAAPAAALRGWLARIGNRNVQGEYYLTDVFALAAADGTPAAIARCREPGEADGANDPWQLAQLERKLQLRRARAACSAGARLADPARFDQRGTLAVGRDVEIDVDVVFEGDVVLGDGVRIGPFCRIRDARLGAGTIVHAHCDIDGIVAEGHALIGPYARLRPGTVLADGVHVGNFVETKKTRIGRGSKANHLSYLGDSEIGAGVNVGAGTITCNYDGANKHVTRIEDGVFIGSNTALVAPVTVGRNATIGAGSVISRDAPADELTIARGRQTTLPGWKRPQKKT